MKIVGIGISLCNTPFQFGFHSPQILRLQAESVVVQLHCTGGISGYGESAPRVYVTGETLASVTALIQDHFARILQGREIASLEDVKETLFLLEEECQNRHIPAYLSALGSIDIALLDALGKSQGVPLHHFLGAIVRDHVSYTLPIPLLPAATIRELHGYLMGAGFSSIKVLMGESPEENCEKLTLVRSLFGTHMEMHIEANGRWTYEQAVANLETLKKFNITAVEQPVSRNDWDGLKKIRDVTGIPVIVDESMCSLSDAKKLLDAGACDILNIKISKCGGLLKAKEIADFALARGIKFQLGSHVGETDILTTAGHHFALTSPNIIHCEGASFLLFKKIRDKKGLKKSDTLGMCERAGLGINEHA